MSHLSLPAILISIVALLFSLSVHEASHAAAAYLLGDRTAAERGRITLNPIPHIDLVGTIIFPLLGLLFGGFFIGWAKPVPFEPARLTRRMRMKYSSALVWAAGPVSNLFLSLVFMCVVAATARSLDPNGWGRVELFRAAFEGPDALARLGVEALPALVLGLGGTLIGLNVLLAAFNLIPLGALDGAGIFRVLVPDRYVHRYDAFRYHPYAWIALVLLGLTGVLSLFLAPIQMGAYRLLLHPARLILGV